MNTTQPKMITTPGQVMCTRNGIEYYLVDFSFEGQPEGASHTPLDVRNCLLANNHVPAEVRVGARHKPTEEVFESDTVQNHRGWIALFNFRDQEDEDKVAYLDPRGRGKWVYWFYPILHGCGNNHYPALCQRPAVG